MKTFIYSITQKELKFDFEVTARIYRVKKINLKLSVLPCGEREAQGGVSLRLLVL